VLVAALAAPPADSLHAPTNAAGAPATEPKMDPEKTDDEMAEGDAAMADLPKMQPDAAPAAPAGDAAKDKADKEAAAQGDGARDPAGRFASMMRSLAAKVGMTYGDADAEAAEDAVLAQVDAKLAELADLKAKLAAIQEREKAAMQADAAAMSDRVIAAGLAQAGAREHLAALCLDNRVAFDALYPVASIEAAEGARALSDRGGPTRDGAAILTQRVGLSGGRAPTTPDGSQTFNMRATPTAVLVHVRITSLQPNHPNNSPGSFFSSHSGGAQFLNMDGSCRFITSSVSIENYRALCSRNGGEVFTGDF
jgi:hypothetical protein